MRFLTLFLETKYAHLYKDVGMIPYCLSKYEKCESSLAYWNNTGMLQDNFYQSCVNLISVRYSENKILRWLYFIREIINFSKKYDVINIYHFALRRIIFSIVLKKINPRLVVYCKLDLNQSQLDQILNKRGSIIRSFKNKVKFFLAKKSIDLYSIEVLKFYGDLIHQPHFCGKTQYIPNGFLIDDTCKQFDDSFKENIILTVGRLGTREKNTELLITSLINIPKDKLAGWKVYLVGPSEPHFVQYLEVVLRQHPYLKDVFVITGNIKKREKLYALYARAKVFCFPSRWEGFPLSMIEAMYFKNYIIATDFPAAFDLMDSGRCGKIIENENSGALQKTLEECLEGKIPMEAIGELAHWRVMERFNWEIIVKKLAKTLQDVCQRQKNA